MLHCSNSDLVKILKDHAHVNGVDMSARCRNRQHYGRRVAIVNAMEVLQVLDKPECIKDCFGLAMHFAKQILHKYNSEEINFIFDRCDVPIPLKTSTEAKQAILL